MTMISVSLSQITVVLQGNYSDETAWIVEQIRIKSPTVAIILSCWESNRDLVSRTCPSGVTIVFSDDPGSPSIPGFKIDNIRRQIVSSRAAFKKVATPWVIKIRSDMLIDPRQLIELISLCTPVADSTLSLFSHKIIVTSLTTLDEIRSGLYFHVCDWLYLGRTEDVAKIFSAPLPEGDFFTHYQFAIPTPEICSRYRSESYLVYHLVRDKFAIDYPFSGYQDLELANLSRRVIKANFVIVNYWNLGLSSSKHKRLYLWLRQDRRGELECGAFLSKVVWTRATIAVGRELMSRSASRLVQHLITYRNQIRIWLS